MDWIPIRAICVIRGGLDRMVAHETHGTTRNSDLLTAKNAKGRKDPTAGAQLACALRLRSLRYLL